MEEKYLKADSIVFAKLKGFSNWPAKIIEKNTKRNGEIYRVEFFGDHTFGDVRATDIIDYSKNKQKVLSITTRKNDPVFLKGINEADTAVMGEKKNKDIKHTTPNSATKTKEKPLENKNISSSAGKKTVSTPSTSEWLKSIKTPKKVETSSQTDMQFDWTLEPLLLELERTKHGSDAVVDKCQELTLANEELINDLKKATKKIEDLQNENYQLKSSLNTQKSLHTKQIETNLFLENEIAQKQTKTSILEQEKNKLHHDLFETNSILKEQTTKLEVTEAAWRADQEILSKVKEQLLKCEGELKDLQNFYGKGETACLNKQKPFPIYNSFSSLEEKSLNSESADVQKLKTRIFYGKPKEYPSKMPENISSERINEDKKPKQHLTLISDSHGRDLIFHLENIMPNEFKFFGHVQSGARLETVISSGENSYLKNYTKSDCIIWIGGTNDICNHTMSQFTNPHGFAKCFLSKLKRRIMYYTHTNIIVATIPFRYDLEENSWENQIIWNINNDIRKIVNEHSHLLLLDLWLLPNHLYTRGGVHFNRRGKRVIAAEVEKLLRKSNSSTDISMVSFPPLPRNFRPQPQRNSAPKTQLHTFLPNPQYTLQDKKEKLLDMLKPNDISVIDSHMEDMIDAFRDDSSIAFSHTISRDFSTDNRSMSAGVAVVFKHKFDRPSTSDYVAESLTRQKDGEGAYIYSLVTKSVYYGKPSKPDYNAAFDQLEKDFEELNLKTLICSPMGCVRDLVDVKHFAERIVTFQQKTQATIGVVSYDQPSARRPLWKGLSHDEFLRRLQEEIDGVKDRQPVEPSSEQQSSVQDLSPNEQTIDSDTNSVSVNSSTSITPISSKQPDSVSSSLSTLNSHQTLPTLET